MIKNAPKGKSSPCARSSRKDQIVQTLTPKAIAQELGVSAKTLRKFLREDAKGNGVETPGKGGRWSIDPDQVESLTERFNAWIAAKAAKAAVEEEVLDEDETLEGDEGDDEVEVLEV